MSSVKIIVTGNAYAYKMAYRRGLHLVSKEIAKRLVDYGIAEIVDGVETAAKPEPKVEVAAMTVNPIAKPKSKKPKKKKK